MLIAKQQQNAKPIQTPLSTPCQTPFPVSKPFLEPFEECLFAKPLESPNPRNSVSDSPVQTQLAASRLKFEGIGEAPGSVTRERRGGRGFLIPRTARADSGANNSRGASLLQTQGSIMFGSTITNTPQCVLAFKLISQLSMHPSKQVAPSPWLGSWPHQIARCWLDHRCRSRFHVKLLCS